MRKNNDLIVQVLSFSLSLLSQRIFSFTSLILTAVAFGWCLMQPDMLRIVSASIFGLLCLTYIGRDNPPVKEKQDEQD